MSDDSGRPLAGPSAALSSERLVVAVAVAVPVAYFALVVPTDLAVLLVGSAAALALAAYAPLVGVLAVTWLLEQRGRLRGVVGGVSSPTR